MYATQFLRRLGLEQDADERAIKRAYARELKQIDQVADAAGFQTLRQAYESALHWVKHKPAHVATFAPPSFVPVLPQVEIQTMPAPVPHMVPKRRELPEIPEVAEVAEVPKPARERIRYTPPPAPPPPPRERTKYNPPPPPEPIPPPRDAGTGESPQQLAQAVFEEFLGICSQITEKGNGRDSALWSEHLKRCANDDRLLNITARANFEFLVARLLADGWRPGHEGLFVAARQVFGWDKDRRRLMELGQVGIWLNQAVDECAMFAQQTSVDCSGQADAVTRVRDYGEPSKGELLTHVPHLRNMAARFPAWTGVIASNARIEQWIEMERAVPAWRRSLRFVRRSSDTQESGGVSWWKVGLFLLAIRALFMFVDSPSESSQSTGKGFIPPSYEQASKPMTESEKMAEAAYERAAGRFYMPPGTRELDAKRRSEQANPPGPIITKPAPPPGRDLTDAERKTIFAEMDYNSPSARPGTYKVAYYIDLDERGEIKKLTKKVGSGLPVLDVKVAEAIRAAAPFGPQILRKFGLMYTQTYKLREQKEPEPLPAETTPEAAQ